MDVGRAVARSQERLHAAFVLSLHTLARPVLNGLSASCL